MPVGVARGVRGDRRDGLGERSMLEWRSSPAEREPGAGGVHVRVDEGRGEQRALARDRAVGGRRIAGGAEPGDPAVDDAARPGRAGRRP